MQKTTLGIMMAWALGTLPVEAVTIDLMVLHSPGLAARYQGDAQTRIQHMINVTNQIYAASGLELTVRAVHEQQVNYPDSGKDDKALRDVTKQRVPAFKEVPALRTRYGADMVVLMRPYTGSLSCGLAWVGGTATYTDGRRAYADGDVSGAAGSMFSHVIATGCGDVVLAHELGHNMGLNHSRLLDGTGGTFHYALGYGVPHSFVTVMAYSSGFKVGSYEYKFSSPDLVCKGQPCGVDHLDQADGADALRALRITTPQIAALYPTMVTETQPDMGDLEESLKERRQELKSVRIFYSEQLAAKESLKQRQGLLKTRFEQYPHQLASLGQQHRDTIDEHNRLVGKYNSYRGRYSAAEFKRIQAIQEDLLQQINKLRSESSEMGRQYNELAKRYQDDVAEYNASWERYNQLVAAVRDANDKVEEARRAVELAEHRYLLALSRQPDSVQAV
ncbi:MAG: M12 family metallo-peptidase [Aeromonas sp.]